MIKCEAFIINIHVFPIDVVFIVHTSLIIEISVFKEFQSASLKSFFKRGDKIHVNNMQSR